MNVDPNDPRLTAFVLGELDPTERAIVEALLIESADSRHAVEEIRLTAQWLSEQLHEESRAHAPTAGLNHRVVAESFLKPTPPPRPWWRKMPSRFHLAAAVVLLAAGLALIPLIRVSIQPVPEREAVAFSALPAPKAAPGAGGRPWAIRSIKAKAPTPPDSMASSESLLARSLPELQAGSGEGLGRNAGSDKYYYRVPAAPNPAQLDSGGQNLPTAAAPAPADNQTAQSAVMLSTGRGPSTRFSLGESQDKLQARRAVRGTRYGRSVLGGATGGRKAADGEGFTGAKKQTDQGLRYADEGDTTRKLAKREEKARGEGEQRKQPPAVEVEGLKDGVSSSNPSQPHQGQAQAPTTGKDKLSEAIPAQDMELAAVERKEVVAALEVYAPIVDNPFQLVRKDRQSTFSIDVDTASYSNIRRFLNHDSLPPPDAVRIEEMLNYFPYHDAPPPDAGDSPFAVHVEVAGCPWNAGHRLARIGIAAKPIDQSRRRASNLVFLVDVSGSMDEPNKLPLVQWGLQRMVEQLNENDRVAIVIYADAAGVFLPSTSCMKKAEISSAIDALKAAGSTNGAAGIQLAYDLATAKANFIKNGINRVILATDGDFNIGISDDDLLVKLITAKAKSGVFLSVLGFGMGNLKDAKLEKLADKGNGHSAYIDSPREAYKVLVEEMGATLINVAKDVKIQVDFAPDHVAEFRLIGYEDRVLAHEDFENDKKDAGDIGAGHHVTALYELTPAKEAAQLALAQQTDAKRDSNDPAVSPSFNVKLRFKKPDQDQSMPTIEHPVVDSGLDFGRASGDLKFAAAVAGFGMLLRDSRFKGTLTFEGVLEIAGPTLVDDPSGYRREFAKLVRKAQEIKSRRPVPVP